MRRLICFVLALFIGMAIAQTAPRDVRLAWVLPVVNDDGSPIGPATAITKIQVFLSASSIPDNSTLTPLAELTSTSTTFTGTFTIAVGGTIFARVKACNASKCSVFSNQTTILVPVPGPGAPTNVTITIVVTP